VRAARARRRRGSARAGRRRPRLAARVIERHFDALARGSEGATVRRWIDALPPELVDSRPRLLLARARMGLFGGANPPAAPPAGRWPPRPDSSTR
jgi:LuxR family maltose regulon positive regulatory protein